MANIFDDLLLRGIRSGQVPERTLEARTWFKEKASRIDRVKVQPDKLIENARKVVSSVEVGNMYMYKYDPKYKEKLPYYDEFPVIFMIGPAANGFYGVNLHYLPPALRLKLMSALYDTTTNKRFDDRTKLAISYNILKGSSKYKYFEPAFKHYLLNHVRSKFVLVHSTEWTISAFLPTAQWRKRGMAKVYHDSRSRVGN